LDEQYKQKFYCAKNKIQFPPNQGRMPGSATGTISGGAPIGTLIAKKMFTYLMLS
jgi:hypothetical protein